MPGQKFQKGGYFASKQICAQTQARSNAIPIARGSHKAPLTPPRTVALPPTPSSLPRGRAGRHSGFGCGDSERGSGESLMEQRSHGQVQRRSFDALESLGDDTNGEQEGMAFGDCDMGRQASGGPELFLDAEDGMDMSSLEVPEDTSFGASLTASGSAAFSSNAFVERPYRARYSSREELASSPALLPLESTECPRDTHTPSFKRLRSPSSSSGINFGAAPTSESDSAPVTRPSAIIGCATTAQLSRQGGFDFQRATRHTVRDSSTSRRTSVVNSDLAPAAESDVIGNSTDRSKRRRADEGTYSRSSTGNFSSSTGLDQVASIDPSLIHIENRDEAMNVDSGRRRRLSLAALPLIPLIRRASRALVSDTATSTSSRTATSLSSDRLLPSQAPSHSRPSLSPTSTHNNLTSRRSVPSLPSLSSFRRTTSAFSQVSPAVNIGASNYPSPSVAPPPIPPPFNPADRVRTHATGDPNVRLHSISSHHFSTNYFSRGPMVVKRASNGAGSPQKKKKAKIRGIGAVSAADGSERLLVAQHLAENSGQGHDSLSTRINPSDPPPSLVTCALSAAAQAILDVMKMPTREPGEVVVERNQFGWNPSREKSKGSEIDSVKKWLVEIPLELSERLSTTLMRLVSSSVGGPTEFSGRSLASILLTPATKSLSLASISPDAFLLSKIPDCHSLASLDLSSNPRLSDATLAKVLAQLPTLERVNFRECIKIGDLSCIALSKASERRLRVVNLSLSAVTIKGLTALLARCQSLEVLKLASVSGLNKKAVNKLVDDATEAALSWRHSPLSNLKTLKIKRTEMDDASLGRLLTLCALTLTSLDVSFTQIKSLDIISTALQTLPQWRLEKLVVSGLPLSASSLKKFFEPLSINPHRSRLKTLKLDAIPNASTRCPGLTDSVLAGILPYWEQLDGLESISLYQNWDLGKSYQPMARFIEVVGKRCKFLDLTSGIRSDQLDGFYPPSADEENVIYDGPARIETLILNDALITLRGIAAICQCKELRSLHLAKTKITPFQLGKVMRACPKLTTLDLSSCRYIPREQRRKWFEAWEKGEVVEELETEEPFEIVQ